MSKQLETIKKLIAEHGSPSTEWLMCLKELEALVEDAVKAERLRCAEIARTWGYAYNDNFILRVQRKKIAKRIMMEVEVDP